MKLSEIKGELALDVAACAMELVDAMAGDERFDSMLSDMGELGGDASGAWRVFCRHLPRMLRDEGIKRRIIGLLSVVNRTSEEEYAENGDVIGDLFELLSTDWESLGFLSQQEGTSK